MTTTDDVHESTDEFAARIVGAIDAASLTLLLSIGHQTGLFDTMAGLPPASSVQIAEAAGLSERMCGSGWAAWSPAVSSTTTR
jgi:hypothetical protein